MWETGRPAQLCPFVAARNAATLEIDPIYYLLFEQLLRVHRLRRWLAEARQLLRQPLVATRS